MSGRVAFLGLALLASVLAAATALELDTIGQPVEDTTGIVPIRHVPKAQPHVASEDPEDHTDEWMATALARPLFSRDRKPTPVVAATGGPTITSLPRLAGVVIGPFGRTAIFAAAEGGKPAVVGEGKTLGAYTIETIEPEGVTVTGPEGTQKVALTADATTRNALAAEIPRPQPPQPQQIAGQAPGVLGVPGLPPGTLPGQAQGGLRQNLLNLRNGLQFQRGLPGIQSPKPNPEGSD